MLRVQRFKGSMPRVQRFKSSMLRVQGSFSNSQIPTFSNFHIFTSTNFQISTLSNHRLPNRSQMFFNIHIHRASPWATSAAFAANNVKLLWHVSEFVHDALPPTLALDFAWVMTGSVKCKQRKSAWIPKAETNTFFCVLFILKIEAGACRAYKSTSTTTDTPQRLVEPKSCIVEGSCRIFNNTIHIKYNFYIG